MIRSSGPRRSPAPARGGFTLIEVLIYIAIFAMMIAFIASILFRVGDSVTANRGRTTVETEADFVMAKLAWAMSGASAINLPAASSSAPQLSVTKFNFASNPVLFQLASGTVTMSRGGLDPVSLTSSNVKVNQLLFTHNPEAVSRPESIDVVLSIAASSSDPAVRASTTIQNTFYLRK